jgi:hypothetical protein
MRGRRFNNAGKTAVITLGITVLTALVHRPLVWVPLLLFMVVCLAAPFCYRCGFFLPMIARGDRQSNAVALTFDDGPDPSSTPVLLSLLKAHGVQATFFVVGRRVRKYPDLVREIIQAGHALGNHSFDHDSLMAFKGRRRIYEDIAATQNELARLGVVPKVFRPPMGITYPALGAVLQALALTAVTFSCRALDRGNRSIRHLSRCILKKARPGDIIMLHDLPPRYNSLDYWSVEVNAVLSGLKAGGLVVRPLGELIGCAIDSRTADRTKNKETAILKG